MAGHSTGSKTKSGRVSKPPQNKPTQDCVMNWAKIHKCRDKKKKKIHNQKRTTEGKKKDKEVKKKESLPMKKTLPKKKFTK